MKRITTALYLLCLLPCAGLPAQEIPKPPTQLAKFDRLLGHWSGSGTMISEPGATPITWNATTRMQKVLGGQFVRRSLTADFGNAREPITGLAFLGFDPQTNKFVSGNLSSMAPGFTAEITWRDANTLISLNTRILGNVRIVERFITTIGDGQYSIVGERALDGGNFSPYVKGSYRKIQPSATVEAVFRVEQPSDLAAARGAAASPQIAKIAGMIGTYKIDGSVIPAPGDTKRAISGNINCTLGLRGTAVELKVKGNATAEMPARNAYIAFTWDAAENCYRILFANNLGQLNSNEGRFVGDQMIITGTQVQDGKPMVARSVLTFGEDGSLGTVTTHSILGANDPVLTFSARYTKQ